MIISYKVFVGWRMEDVCGMRTITSHTLLRQIVQNYMISSKIFLINILASWSENITAQLRRVVGNFVPQRRQGIDAERGISCVFPY
jgi:pyoverdine/dityrosine biosynthesis protein Dit1